MTQGRVEAGRPDGGQFAKSPHSAPDPSVTLSDDSPMSPGERMRRKAERSELLDSEHTKFLAAQESLEGAARGYIAGNVRDAHPHVGAFTVEVDDDYPTGDMVRVSEMFDRSGNEIVDDWDASDFIDDELANRRGTYPGLVEASRSHQFGSAAPARFDVDVEAAKLDRFRPEPEVAVANMVRDQFPDAAYAVAGVDERADGTFEWTAGLMTAYGQDDSLLGTVENPEGPGGPAAESLRTLTAHDVPDFWGASFRVDFPAIADSSDDDADDSEDW